MIIVGFITVVLIIIVGFNTVVLIIVGFITVVLIICGFMTVVFFCSTRASVFSYYCSQITIILFSGERNQLAIADPKP